eukprot:CAMPEP_0119266236 /NCGR_PEP_ID=MMETSP1329-20130426/4789_1 /TAXON_ID=114041 /ORGANISM="Genus nov. species nov., Strain RCC1024" /LENGTH=360 /DNA_ID=CAMNT_0007266105 /DNA_START=85 /DNA_END=1163 /DNA_ORIENTATION=+
MRFLLCAAVAVAASALKGPAMASQELLKNQESLAALAGRGRVRWGIIGCGAVCERKSGPALQKAQRSALVAVMRRDGKKAADYAKRHGVPKSYDTVEGLLGDPEVDAVYVATPPGAHLEIALKVAAAGKPCYMEKPGARSATEEDKMERAFRAKKLPLFVAYYRRAYPRYVALRKALRSGRLGDIKQVVYMHARPPGDSGWRTDVEASGGGLVLDVGTHVLDLLDFLLGPLKVETHRATGAPGGPETRVEIGFTVGKARGRASWDFESDFDTMDRLEITGSEGSVRCDECMNGRDLVWKKGGKTETEKFPPPDPVQLPLVTAVVAALLDGTACPSTAASSLRCARVVDEALGDYYGGRGG